MVAVRPSSWEILVNMNCSFAKVERLISSKMIKNDSFFAIIIKTGAYKDIKTTNLFKNVYESFENVAAM
jgi:hypothetical protein